MNLDTIRHLKAYQLALLNERARLRQQANDISAKLRELKKVLTVEMEQELKNQEQVEQAWTTKTLEELQSDPSLLELIRAIG